MIDGPGEREPLPPGALQRAGDRIFRGPGTSWEAKSRFGPPGKLARRVLRRLLRPVELRQHEIDVALFDAVREAGGHGAEPIPELELAAPLVGRELEEASTPVGDFLVDRRDQMHGRALIEHGSWAGEVAGVVQTRLRPGATFVDVGANIGYFSVWASALVGERGRVFAIEPDPSNVELLRANLWRNRCRNVRVLPVAAWSEPGHVSLVSRPEGGALSEVRPSTGADEDGGTLVPCARLDELIGPPVDLMKVDAQFNDHRAVAGAAALIGASPEISVAVEFERAELERRGEDVAGILDGYRGLGFELFVLEGESARRASDEEILGGAPHLDLMLARPGTT